MKQVKTSKFRNEVREIHQKQMKKLKIIKINKMFAESLFKINK